MKVGIYETVEVSDEQRVAIAQKLDGDGAKKRQATRDEMKAWIWGQGSEWETWLDDGSRDEPEPSPGEDLLGGDDDEDADLI